MGEGGIQRRTVYVTSYLGQPTRDASHCPKGDWKVWGRRRLARASVFPTRYCNRLCGPCPTAVPDPR